MPLRRSRSGLTIILMAALLFLLHGIGSASAAPPGDQPGDGIVTITKPNGGVAGWVSSDVLNNRFDELPEKVQQILANAPREGGIAARSAFKCAGPNSVCIDVEGEDLLVEFWGTTMINTGSLECRSAYFETIYGGNTSYYVGEYLCPDEPDGMFYDGTGAIGPYMDGTILCNTWENSPGRPCADIHD